MKHIFVLAGVALLISGTGCNSVSMDPGPTQTVTESVDGGKAESVRAEIHMGAGDLRLQGGGEKLMDATFKYSESLGRPTVQYDSVAPEGRLTVESPKNGSSTGKMVNDWVLRMGSQLPLDAKVNVGAGKADLDVSKLRLRSLEIQMGAGELKLNMAGGSYPKDVSVQVSTGVGEARIKLPKDVGVVVDAKAGIGGVKAEGMIQREGRYFNAAYAEGKAAIHMDVRGGIGEVTLTVEN